MIHHLSYCIDYRGLTVLSVHATEYESYTTLAYPATWCKDYACHDSVISTWLPAHYGVLDAPHATWLLMYAKTVADRRQGSMLVIVIEDVFEKVRFVLRKRACLWHDFLRCKWFGVHVSCSSVHLNNAGPAQ